MGQKHAQPVSGVLPTSVPHLGDSVKHTFDTARNRSTVGTAPVGSSPAQQARGGVRYSATIRE